MGFRALRVCGSSDPFEGQWSPCVPCPTGIKRPEISYVPFGNRRNVQAPSYFELLVVSLFWRVYGVPPSAIRYSQWRPSPSCPFAGVPLDSPGDTAAVSHPRLVPSQSFASRVLLGRKCWKNFGLKGRQIINLPGVPTCLGSALLLGMSTGKVLEKRHFIC
jgi:hypothetical protein